MRIVLLATVISLISLLFVDLKAQEVQVKEVVSTIEMRPFFSQQTDSTKLELVETNNGREIIEYWYLNNGTYLMFRNNVLWGRYRTPNYAAPIEYQIEENKRRMSNQLKEKK